MKKVYLLIFSTFIVLMLIFSGDNADNAIVLDTKEVEIATVYNNIFASGYIEQSDKNIISIDQNGIVQTLNFSVGDTVLAGDTIMTIQKTDYVPYVSAFSIDGNLIGKSDILSTNDEIITIKSNITGKIISIPDSVGSGIIKGVPFLSVSNSDNLVATISVSERYASVIAVGQEVILTGDGFSGSIYGKISEISPVAKKEFSILNDSSNISIEVTVEFEQDIIDLISGLSVSASIKVDERNEAIIIPYTCVFQEEKQEFVYILQDNIIKKQAITTGYELEENIEVISGLKKGDILILNYDLGELS